MLLPTLGKAKKRGHDAFRLSSSPLELPWALAIRKRLDILHRRLVDNGAWNMGEKFEVSEQARLLKESLEGEAWDMEHPLEDTRPQQQVIDDRSSERLASLLRDIVHEDAGSADQIDVLCVCPEYDHSNCQQTVAEVSGLYTQAVLVIPLFNQLLVDIAQRLGFSIDRPGSPFFRPAGPGLKLGGLKTLVQTFDDMIKCDDCSLRCESICDIISASFVVVSLGAWKNVLSILMSDKRLTIICARRKFASVVDPGFGDVDLILYLNSDHHKHKCKVRVVHERLMSIAEEMGDDTYRYFRRGETEEHSSSSFQSTVIAPKMRKLCKSSVPNTLPTDVPFESVLAQYPNIPLTEYAPDGHHLPINANYPGLRAVHKDPWIFLIPGLLTRYECEQLMIKGGTRVVSADQYASSPKGRAHRTSSECRIAREETRGIQARYSELLGVPVDNLEAAKVSCYRPGQYFKNHVDPLSNMSFLENRIATLFVYLNTCEHGGETCFLSLPSKRTLNYTVGEKVACLFQGEGDFPGVIQSVHPDGTVDVDFDDGEMLERVPRAELRAYETLSVKPLQGLGVLFFPAYLPSSPLAVKSYKQLDRHLVHEGSAAVDEKWVHQQWVWPSRPQAHHDGASTNTVLL